MKDKNRIFTGLTILVIILCGMLPRLIGVVEDCFADQNVAYGDEKTVSLIRELNDVEKMYLLKSGTPVSISEERTKLKWTNMREVLDAALSWYTQNGFILGEANAFTITRCEPVLYYSSQMPNVAGVFWKIDMELWDYYGQSISLCLDDQSGKVLLISYECLEKIYYKGDFPTPLAYLFDCYQSERDWHGILYAGQDAVEPSESEVYKHKCEMEYRFGDTIYGENTIVFTMTETGFSIRIGDEYNKAGDEMMQQ